MKPLKEEMRRILEFVWNDGNYWTPENESDREKSINSNLARLIKAVEKRLPKEAEHSKICMMLEYPEYCSCGAEHFNACLAEIKKTLRKRR